MRSRSTWLPSAAALTAALILIGVVMADTHEPVAIKTDAPREKGVEVATFALG